VAQDDVEFAEEATLGKIRDGNIICVFGIYLVQAVEMDISLLQENHVLDILTCLHDLGACRVSLAVQISHELHDKALVGQLSFILVTKEAFDGLVMVRADCVNQFVL